jgi:molecular chaperone GrpE (heat shock protein)
VHETNALSVSLRRAFCGADDLLLFARWRRKRKRRCDSTRVASAFKSRQKMDDIEKRLAAVEKEIAEMKERRARLIPKELDDSPEMQEMYRDHVKSTVARAVAGWRASIGQNRLSAKAAEFETFRQTALKQMEEAQKIANQKEAAELLAVLDYYSLHGSAPESHQIEEAEDSSLRVVQFS